MTLPHQSDRVRLVAAISLVAFGLHLVWESIQCIPLFVHGEPPEDGFLVTMARASLGDVVLTWVAYGVTAAAVRDLLWLHRRWDWRAWSALEAAALVLSVGFELVALHTGRWAYTTLNPTIPGVGISVVPVLQLAILFPVTFAAASRACSRDGDAGYICIA